MCQFGLFPQNAWNAAENGLRRRFVCDRIEQIDRRAFMRILVDMDDLIFYEVVMEKREDDSYLVTGNQKHYPVRDYIVTPAEMMKIIDLQ